MGQAGGVGRSSAGAWFDGVASGVAGRRAGTGSGRVAGSRAGSWRAGASAPSSSKFCEIAPRLKMPGREWP